MEAPEAPASKSAGAMDELVHEQVEAREKSGQEQTAIGRAVARTGPSREDACT